MSDKAGTHPEKEDLTAYGLGKLPPDAAAKIELHLDECPSCCDTMLELQDDTFLALVKKSPPAVSGETDSDGTSPREASHSVFQPTVLESDNGTTSFTLAGEDVELPRELQEHNRYRVLEHIGHGGMGDVYKAEHMVMNRPVALKVIKPELVQNKSAIQRFHREVQAAARLHHGNIVTAHDAERAGNSHFLVMEFVDGVNLDEVLKERGPLPVDEACDVIRQTAQGLEHAHTLGMVHRDIKPHNLMLTESGNVKILDFGLASFASHAATEEAESDQDIEVTPAPTAEVLHQLTQMGTMMGTPDYIAPEQAKDARTADIRADIYSLGCTFYTLLTGKPPFKGDSVAEKLSAHAQEDPEPLSHFRDDVPTEVETILQKMMAKDPAVRYQTPAKVAEMLRAFSNPRATQHETNEGLSWQQRMGFVIGVPSMVCMAITRTSTNLSLPGLAACWLLAVFLLWVLTGWGNRTEKRPSWITAPIQWTRPLFWVGCAFTVFLAGVIYYIQTDYGVVRVEVADESLHVEFAGETITVKDGERKLKIRPGKQKLFVTLGEVEFYTDDFQLGRGDEFRFKAELQSGEIVVQKDGQRFSSKPWALQTDSVAEEWQCLAGRWQAVSAAEFSREIDTGKVAKLGLVVNAEKRTMALQDFGGADTAEAELDPSKSPKQIDISKDREGPKMRGIYKLKGDNLTLCLANGGHPRPTMFTTLSDNGGGAQLFVFRRVTGNPESTLTKEKVKSLVAEAAGIPNVDWAKIAAATEIPTPNFLDSQSLSLILFSLAAHEPQKLASEAPELSRDFHYLTSATTHPAEIAAAIWISRSKGYASFIQPEYVTEATVSITNDSAHGTISFEVADLYRGQVNYVARHREGHWQVDELHLRNSGLSLQRDENGKWKSASVEMIDGGQDVVLEYSLRDGDKILKLDGQELSLREVSDRLKDLIKDYPNLVVRLDAGDGVDWRDSAHAKSFLELNQMVSLSGANAKLPAGFTKVWTRINRLKQIGSALQDYFNTHQSFPPTEHQKQAFGKSGTPYLSWRVHLLPNLGQDELYKQFHLDEPWDSEHNIKLLDQIPDAFQTADETTKTTLLAVVGEGTAYEGQAGLRITDIKDGLSKTAIAVDAGPGKAVPWTKPADLPFDKLDPIRTFGTSDFGDVFLALMADGSVNAIAYDNEPEQLRNLFLRADGNPLDLSKKRPTPLPALTIGSGDPAVDKVLSDALAIYTFEEDTFYREQGRMRVRDISGNGQVASIEDDKSAYAAEGRVGGGLACNRSITGFAPKGLPGSGIKAGDQNIYELPMPKFRLPEPFLVGREEYTVTAWVRDAGKATAPSGKSLRMFFQEGFPKGNNAIHPLAFTFAEQRIQAMCLGELIDPSYKNAQALPAEDIIPKDEWFFLALTLITQDEKSTLRITVNDKTIEQPFAAIPKKPEGGFGLIGGIDGMIDELAFFKRALSEEEIQILRQHGLNNKPLKSGKKPTAPLPSLEKDQVTLIREFQGHTNIVKSVDFSPDGKLIASASGFPRGDNSVRIWDRETGRELDRLDEHFIPVVFATFSPDGKHLLSGDIRGRMILWSLDEKREGWRRRITDWRNNEIMIDHATFTPDGKRVVYLKVNPHAADAAIKKASESPLDKQEQGVLRGLEQQALAQIQRTIEVVDATNGKSVKTIPLKKGEAAMSALAVTPDGTHVAVPMYDGTVRLISLDTEEEIRRYEPPKYESPQTFAFVAAVSADGNKLAAGYGGHKVRVWELKTGKVLADLDTANLSTNHLAFFSDNRRLAASGPVVQTESDAAAACIVDTHTREILASTPAILGDGLAFALAPDEDSILTAGGAYWDATSLKWQGTNDYDLHLWDLFGNVSE